MFKIRYAFGNWYFYLMCKINIETNLIPIRRCKRHMRAKHVNLHDPLEFLINWRGLLKSGKRGKREKEFGQKGSIFYRVHYTRSNSIPNNNAAISPSRMYLIESSFAQSANFFSQCPIFHDEANKMACVSVTARARWRNNPASFEFHRRARAKIFNIKLDQKFAKV